MIEWVFMDALLPLGHIFKQADVNISLLTSALEGKFCLKLLIFISRALLPSFLHVVLYILLFPGIKISGFLFIKIHYIYANEVSFVILFLFCFVWDLIFFPFCPDPAFPVSFSLSILLSRFVSLSCSLIPLCPNPEWINQVEQMRELAVITKVYLFIYYLSLQRLCFSVCILFIYWFVCMYVTSFSQKLLDRIAWNFQGWFVIIQGPID